MKADTRNIKYDNQLLIYLLLKVNNILTDTLERTNNLIGLLKRFDQSYYLHYLKKNQEQ